MTKQGEQQAQALVQALRRHPRVGFQGLASGEGQVARMAETLPLLVPFNQPSYFKLLPILDWDHRLPSRTGILRIYGYYSEATLRLGEAEVAERQAQIRSLDKFPEFDVPDYAGISADESYEGEVDLTGAVARLRLASNWRREIGFGDSRAAVKAARRSEQFRELMNEVRGRPDYLGDLEAVSWTPPCETDYASWTIDVWYLMYLDAAVGKGRSFLVDPQARRVVGVREFVVRAS
ncbi:MAG: hypothetical protein IT371_09075 [Deltaproteobacteria bacterium]|nr:hypothetical protein [Deltaproteobacteria bacterium]